MNQKTICAITVITVTILMSLMGIPCSFAKEWPNDPIQIIEGWGPGSVSDLISRMLAEGLSKSLGVPVIVENKAGATGLLSLSLVSKAKPDGYTLGFMSCTAITEKPFMRKVPFDPVHGFSYISQVFNYGYAFAVRSDKPWKTFPEFVDAAKKQPGNLTCATVGIGSTNHVALAKLEQKIPGLRLIHVPMEAAKVAPAILGGHVDSCLVSNAQIKPYIDAGQLRLLALPQKDRWSAYPDVPTWLDLGYGVYAHSPGAYVAPHGLPEALQQKLDQEFKKAMSYSGFKGIIKEQSIMEFYKPGKELYRELMEMYEENKTMFPKLGFSELPEKK